MANRESLQKNLNANYDLDFFQRNVLLPVFGNSLTIASTPEKRNINASEEHIVKSVKKYGTITLADYRELDLYDVELAENVVIERSKVGIGAAIKKYIFANNAVLVNFHYQNQPAKSWRLSFIAKEQQIEGGEIIKGETNPKRFTYVLGQKETCRTAAERFTKLSMESEFTIDKFKEAFSVEKLSKAFFDEYKEHYSHFVDHLCKRNIKAIVFNGDEKAIRDFAKKLLGRIVFLYFVQKKGWLGASNTKYSDGSPDFLAELFISAGKNENFYNSWLKKLFYDSLNNENRSDESFKLPDGKTVKIPFLNGGLFEDDDPRGILTFPPKLFSDLFEFFKQYNFTIYEDSPDDHTVAVDPEMLGHIFENLLEDNKDKGAYYTPKEIVHYMCQESLIEYLAAKLSVSETASYQEAGTMQTDFLGNDGKKGQLAITQEHKGKSIGISHADIEQFIKHKQLTDEIKKYHSAINKYLDEVKICDPAIGSGAFPMGLLHEIFNAKLLLNEETGVNAAEIKQNIIQNSIYGVDIESGAVDIARLRFWLSLVVDEELPRPLPNLDYKIVVGDSLVPKFDGEIVDIEWDLRDAVGELKPYKEKIRKGLQEIVEKQKQFFKTKTNKPKLQTEIRNMKIDLLINQLTFDKLKYQAKNKEQGKLGFTEKTREEKIKEAEIKLKIVGYEQTLKKLETLKRKTSEPLHFFDWKLDFPEIMNPAIAVGKSGFDIVIANPPYIDSETMVNTGNEELRTILTNKLSFAKGNWDIYIAFFDLGFSFLNSEGNLIYISPDKWISKPFGYELRKGLLNNFSAIAEAGRKVFENALVDSIITSLTKYSKSHLKILRFDKSQINELGLVDKKILIEPYAFDWLFSPNINLLYRIEACPITLKYFGECENACATSDAYKLKEYLIDINPKHFDSEKQLKVINTGTIGKYLSKWGQSRMTYLKDKYDAPVVNKNRFSKDFSNSYGQKSVKPKLIIKGLTLLDACIDEDGIIVPGKTTLIITKENSDDLKFQLVLLNSKLPLFYIKEKYRGSSYNQGINFSTDMIDSIPVPSISKNTIERFKVKADLILKRKIKNQDTFSIEEEIDLMVYKLYQLTYDEVLVVDKEFENQMSRKEYDKLDYGFEYVEPDKTAAPQIKLKGKKKGKGFDFSQIAEIDF